MKIDSTNDMIGVAEAAYILGFKQRKKIDLLIKKGHLRSYPKKNSKQIWLSKNEVYALPQSLPVPPTKEMLNSLIKKSSAS